LSQGWCKCVKCGTDDRVKLVRFSWKWREPYSWVWVCKSCSTDGGPPEDMSLEDLREKAKPQCEVKVSVMPAAANKKTLWDL